MNFTQQLAASHKPHISLPAEEIFSIGGLPITNSMILGFFGYVALIGMFLWVAKSVQRGSKNKFVLFIQWIYEMLLGTVEEVIGDKKIARQLAPLAITLFFFIITNYYFGILPFVGAVTYNDIPFFRGLVADLNVTFALAIITMVAAQIYAVKTHGFFGNAGRYLRNPFRDPAGAFEGVLELIAEFSRLMALSFRLFGNVFAGEVLLVMVAFLTSYFSPIALPFFLIFELFIGAIQSYVFFMLTVVFISLGTMHHTTPDDHSKPDKAKKAALAGSGVNS